MGDEAIHTFRHIYGKAASSTGRRVSSGRLKSLVNENPVLDHMWGFTYMVRVKIGRAQAGYLSFVRFSFRSGSIANTLHRPLGYERANGSPAYILLGGDPPTYCRHTISFVSSLCVAF